MAFDGLFTRKIVEDIQSLVSGRIHKIAEPSSDTIILTIRSERKNKQLLLSTHANFSRFHLTTEKYDNPFDPPMFLRVLRKHLDGGIIQSITQIGNDRLVEIDIHSRDEIGDLRKRTIVLEIMGRHSNIILIDGERKIIDGFKHHTPNTNTARTIMPGFKYEYPPTVKKLNPFEVDDVNKYINYNAGKIDRQLLQQFEGFSPLITKEIVSRRPFMNQETLVESFDEVMNEVDQTPKPVIYSDDSTNKEIFYFMPLHTYGNNYMAFDTIHECLDRFYESRGERERVKQRALDLVKIIDQHLQKNRNKLEKLINEKEAARTKDEQQLYGELITANMYQINQGDKTLETINYYNNEPISIPLNPTKSPSMNAQYYYKQYNRLKTREIELEKQIKLTHSNILYFESLEQQLAHISVEDIDDIREELEDQGFVKKRKSKKKKKSNKITITTFVSSDGQTILLGKNNKQNDYLTHKVARKNQLWFHTKDIPGSHVVIQEDEPTNRTIEEAAMIAAYYSKASQSAQIPVDYTAIRNVHKPSGAKPGFVTYDSQSTLYVTTDYDDIKKLLKQ
ncbi:MULTISPECIES: Rqc2 family fibronectin-binding protein [Mammaliicoccus]|uniref:Rqc2 family fibronectin-binding protein n=1 Tax=Mammaliicoccus TaxID=2803850 RepID=UPI001AADA040|nr:MULTISPECIES: NFACT RNA binding domain-containing protein [Mammaliicoccus]MBO3062879.1 NFACT family protein [Mammaliicoccus fleurettii]MBW0764480.1 fibronectin/fibrinogen-binding protein [Mammaliicoccus fleurettii]MEB7780012.1 NFACT family protein [Mammaliicoccus fleurettii]